MFTPEALDNYKKAGKLSAEALAYGAKLIKPGVPILEVVEKVEEFIRSKNAGFAFPVTVSMDTTAAHDTAFPGEDRVFEGQVVKLDLGAHFDGYAGDNAVTVDLSGKYGDLVKASMEARDNAVKIVQIGTTLGEIGKTVQETIQSHGFEPIRNLSGHQIDQYNLHCGLSIPNYDTKDGTMLKKGMIIAIEPFATTGDGMIKDKGRAAIYSQIGSRQVRNPVARKVAADVEKFKGLPFASRWLAQDYQLFKLTVALRELVQNDVLRAYSPLVERSDGLVSQAEHTVLVDDKVTVLTKQ